MQAIYEFMGILLFIAIAAFFAAAEVSFLSISNIRMHTMIEKKANGAESLQRLKQNRRRVIIALLIGNNIASVAASVFATSMAITLLGSEAGIGAAVAMMSFLLIAFGDIMPKSAATTYGDKFILAVAPAIEVFCWVFTPLVLVFEAVNRLVPGIYSTATGIEKFSEEEVRTAVRLGAKHKSITEKEEKMIANVLEFDKKPVEAVMTPVSYVAMINAGTPVWSAFEIAAKNKHSRFPIVNEQGRAIGFVNLREIAMAMMTDPKTDCVHIAQKPLVFGPKERIHNVFERMQKAGKDISVVADSSQKMIGIVTIEDLLEELVGEIQ
ncbi:MAG: CNNM domain-containing protein [Candidatus Micrarchaeia archaeon]